MNFIGIIILLISVFNGSTAQINLEELKSELEYKIDKVAQINHLLEKRVEDLTIEIHKLMAENQNLTKESENIVPIGFVYTQLPSQQEPNAIWTKYGWEDITHSYAGLFFRVLGGDSSSFNSIQEDNNRQLQDVLRNPFNVVNDKSKTHYKNGDHISIPLNGGQSEWIFTGTWIDQHENDAQLLSFKSSSGEVRPRNTAIKVWKRIN